MYGLENSGIGRYLINLVDEISKLDSINFYLLLLKRKYFDLLKLPQNWQKILLDIPHYTIREQIALTVKINSLKPDLAHFPNFNIPVLNRGKFIVTIHDMTMHSQGTDSTTLPLYKYYTKRLPYRYAFRKAIDKSEKILTPSETTKAEIVNYFKVNPDKIVVTYEGLNENYLYGKKFSRDLEILAKFKLINKDYFFYVGNAYPHKNLDIVIKAIVDLNKTRGKRTEFIIAGSRDVFTNRLQKVIEKYNAQNYIRLIGFVRDDELQVIYKNSLGFVYASLAEGFGLQGLEAMASGTILLASNVPIFREIYQDNAFYFKPDDVQSISGTMYTVLNLSPEDKSKYVSKAQEFIKKYSWSKMAKETLSVYNSVLNGKV